MINIVLLSVTCPDRLHSALVGHATQFPEWGPCTCERTLRRICSARGLLP
jgi:hypothetical protein